MKSPSAYLTIGALLSVVTVAAAENHAQADPILRIMTQNMDEGTDYLALAAATTPAEFAAAVTQTYNDIESTDPAARAAVMAATIATQQPDLVALQEASVVRTGDNPQTTSSDLLTSLLTNLNARGQHYAAVAIGTELDAEAPSTLGFNVRLTTQDVILAHTDLPASRLSIANPQTQQFASQLVIPTAVGPIALTRGWASVDATVDGQTFHFVTTHLDTGMFSPALQTRQALELLGEAGATTLPTVYAGDFNSVANDPLDPTYPTYQSLVAAGLVDAWTTAHPNDPGFTCCESPDLKNPTPTLTQRIDLALVTRDIGVEDADLVGIDPPAMTEDGLWSSDHAGLVVTLDLPVPEPTSLAVFGVGLAGLSGIRRCSWKAARQQ